jgi:hypothetical protein
LSIHIFLANHVNYSMKTLPASFIATIAATNIWLPIYASEGSNDNIGVGVTTNTYNLLQSGGGGYSRGPVAPAYSPSAGGNSLGHPGESRLRLQTQQLCGIYDSIGKLKDVMVLNSSVEVAEASEVRQRGISGGLSLFNVGVSLGHQSIDVMPSKPHSNFQQYILEAEAAQIISCESLQNHGLRQERVEDSIRTLNFLRRGRLQGMESSESAQGEYERARRKAGLHHPHQQPAAKAARQGDYEGATKLLQKPTTPSPPIRGLW